MRKTTILLKYRNYGHTDELICALSCRLPHVTVISTPSDDIPELRNGEHKRCCNIFDHRLVDEVIEEISRKYAIERIVNNNTYLGYVHYKLLQTYFPEHPSLVWILNARIKSETRFLMNEAGLSSVRFRVVREFNEMKDAASFVGFPAVLKPVGGQGSDCVYRVDSLGELEKRYREFRSSKYEGICEGTCSCFEANGRVYNLVMDALVEEYLPGDEFTVDGYVTKGKAVVAAVHQKVNSLEENGFRDVFYLTHPVDWDDSKQRMVVDYIDHIVRTLGMDETLFHIELRMCGKQINLIEVNPRLGGGMIYENVLHSSGLSLIDIYADMLCEKPVPTSPPKQHSIAYDIGVLVEGEGVVADIDGIDDLRYIHGVHTVLQCLRPGDVVHRSQGERYAVLFGGTVASHDEAMKIFQDTNGTVRVIYTSGGGSKGLT